MSPKPVQATLRWLSPEDGGRRQPFTGERYVAPADIDGVPPGQDWSLVVTFTDASRTRADVRFLVEAAPHERLTAGAQFRLREGRRVVAEGVVAAAPSDVVPAVVHA